MSLTNTNVNEKACTQTYFVQFRFRVPCYKLCTVQCSYTFSHFLLLFTKCLQKYVFFRLDIAALM